MADYAALQHRWTYFIQDAPPLPRKNVPSRRERERLLQVPKLRYNSWNKIHLFE